ncbi:MAG: S46 family peptidase, partial [Alistipes sp.]|nr:S46 family peptidase [Alistipes sp.]
MKKFFLLLVASAVSFSAFADEGMWLLPYLQKMNIRDMKARGCKLSAEQIYSAERSSLKDAIVIFGNGCTGEIVSPEGLLFTNHHCGFSSIQELSSVEHDYLKHGFWAMSQAEELPAPGLSVRFIRKIMDVTPEIIGNVPSAAGQEEFEKITAENRKALADKLGAEYPGMSIDIDSFFGGNQFCSFVMEVYTDVRLVGAPP